MTYWLYLFTYKPKSRNWSTVFSFLAFLNAELTGSIFHKISITLCNGAFMPVCHTNLISYILISFQRWWAIDFSFNYYLQTGIWCMNPSWFASEWTSEYLFLVPQTSGKLVWMACWLPHAWQCIGINGKSPWKVILQFVVNVKESNFHSKRAF